MGYRVVKTYGHDIGLSCVFRQWRAQSHCAQLHGYSLAFRFTFEANELDKNGWVVNFGSLAPLKENLQKYFDHTTLVAEDDPQYKILEELAILDIINIRTVRRTGCEAFARMAYEIAVTTLELEDIDLNPRGIRIVSVVVAEHGANAAEYRP